MDFSLFDWAEETADANEEAALQGEPTYSVAQLNREIRYLLEDGYRNILVEGELSNVTRASSGHYYFTLNDPEDNAQVRCVLFRSDAQRVKVPIENGALVRARGGLSLYEARGSYQLIARSLSAVGEGTLQARFEALRKKLEAEGLLDLERKRPLPAFARTIGVVTSASGAAIHDILRVAAGRAPVRIVISDCLVQGQGAAASIAAAIAAIQRLDGLDLVIVSRGGGSAEDLWAFNEEVVARAIATCQVPVISGVGHEVDVTISDLVADKRAATPSNAAEIAVPDRATLERLVRDGGRRLERAFDAIIDGKRLRLERLQQTLTDPRHAVAGVRQRLASLANDLERLIYARLRAERATLHTRASSLLLVDPRRLLIKDRERLLAARARLEPSIARALRSARHRLEALTAKLDALSPLSVLGRGYAVVFADDHALRDASTVSPGSELRIRLHKGRLAATVSSVERNDEPGDARSTSKEKP